MIRMVMRAVPLALLPLSACAGQYHPPVIRYDDAVQAVRLPDPPKPVQVVEVPTPLPLPGQLKPLPSRRSTARRIVTEAPDPTVRVTQANLAARIQPTRAGYVNAVQITPTALGRSIRSMRLPGKSPTSCSSLARSWSEPVPWRQVTRCGGSLGTRRAGRRPRSACISWLNPRVRI